MSWTREEKSECVWEERVGKEKERGRESGKRKREGESGKREKGRKAEKKRIGDSEKERK